ncbi:unnamed protein product [Bursaphelenchus okinawaensis]|uniref:Uncharacterized protein n=1 Tax=Bursaphelenchus okinawaensis TaxID=465554 RepID=A0A811JUH5_9BILA|nr:unnamed protein product [Bursaphelenchus okinawaensis]CAG9084151.1 unnamed protein product [Bursaphelenchus okinawaensis]
MYVQTTQIGAVCVVFAVLFALLFISMIIWLRLKQHKAQRIQTTTLRPPKRAFRWRDDSDAHPVMDMI